MKTRILKLVQIATATVVFATAFALPGAAKDRYSEAHWRMVQRHHYHHHLAAAERPLTVTKRVYREPIAAAPDPFHGPAAIITGPIAIVATIASLPFRAAGAVFPAYGNPGTSPLVLLGAPIHLAGQIAQFPFHVAGSAFGAPPNVAF